MGTAAGMLDKARKTIGLGEPNYIQRWFDANVYHIGGNFAWCDAAVTYWGYHTDNALAVCPNGHGRAYTVYHAGDFQKRGQWYSGTVENIKKAKPGDIVFFDWSGSNNISAIDHVGVVEKNLGDGRLQTIEGNTSDQCLRRVRGASVIAGFGRPKYASSPPKPAPKPLPKSKLTVPDGSPILKVGSTGKDSHDLQQCLNAVMKSKLETDGVLGALTKKAVIAFQTKYKLVKDGEYGPKSAAVMKKAVAAL